MVKHYAIRINMAGTNFEIHRYQKICRCVAALCVVELLEENKRSLDKKKDKTMDEEKKGKGLFYQHCSGIKNGRYHRI